jgi:hypothetical protein
MGYSRFDQRSRLVYISLANESLTEQFSRTEVVETWLQGVNWYDRVLSAKYHIDAYFKAAGKADRDSTPIDPVPRRISLKLRDVSAQVSWQSYGLGRSNLS